MSHNNTQNHLAFKQKYVIYGFSVEKYREKSTMAVQMKRVNKLIETEGYYDRRFLDGPHYFVYFWVDFHPKDDLDLFWHDYSISSQCAVWDDIYPKTYAGEYIDSPVLG